MDYSTVIVKRIGHEAGLGTGVGFGLADVVPRPCGGGHALRLGKMRRSVPGFARAAATSVNSTSPSPATTIAWLAATEPAGIVSEHARGDRRAENRDGRAARTRSRRWEAIVTIPVSCGRGDLVEQNRAVGEHEQFHARYA